MRTGIVREACEDADDVRLRVIAETKGYFMSDTMPGVSGDDFRKGVLALLDETFDHVQGAYLDPGDSFFPTLEDVSAAEASKVVGTCGNSIAGQVAHVIFYIDVSIQYMRGENPGRQDWSIAWKTIEVDDEEWATLKRQLRERQEQVVALIGDEAVPMTEDFAGGAMALIAHTAFHLGQVRHALCMLGE